MPHSPNISHKDIYRYECQQAREYLKSPISCIERSTRRILDVTDELKSYIKATTHRDAEPHHIRPASMNGHVIYTIDIALHILKSAEKSLKPSAIDTIVERLNNLFRNYRKSSSKQNLGEEYLPSTFEGEVARLREKVENLKRKAKKLEKSVVREFPQESQCNQHRHGKNSGGGNSPTSMRMSSMKSANSFNNHRRRSSSSSSQDGTVSPVSPLSDDGNNNGYQQRFPQQQQQQGSYFTSSVPPTPPVAPRQTQGLKAAGVQFGAGPSKPAGGVAGSTLNHNSGGNAAAGPSNVGKK